MRKFPKSRGLVVDGNKLRELRLARQWTQEEAAHRAGISDRVVRKAESSQRIDARSIETLAALYSSPSRPIGLRDLLCEEQRSPKISASKDPGSSMLGEWLTGIWVDQRLEVIDELASESIVLHCEAGSIAGRAKLRQRIQNIWNSFSCFETRFETLAERDCHAVCRWTIEMTYSGECHGRPTTRSRVTAQLCTSIRFDAGKIEEMWELWESKLTYQELVQRVGRSRIPDTESGNGA